ncbi:MAG: DUF1232 domain-containing protein [Candidatus Coatesbacteria bacterium]|nr:DUF1232 domain-containing protein [Candidatus Coatesbacteria bacterium]
MSKANKSKENKKQRSDHSLIPSGNVLSFLFHLPNFAKLYWKLFWDRRAPKIPKIVLILAIIYLLSPIDLLPDFAIPGVGYVDDLALLALAFKYFIKAMPKDLLSEKIESIDKDANVGRP